MGTLDAFHHGSIVVIRANSFEEIKPVLKDAVDHHWFRFDNWLGIEKTPENFKKIYNLYKIAVKYWISHGRRIESTKDPNIAWYVYFFEDFEMFYDGDKFNDYPIHTQILIHWFNSRMDSKRQKIHREWLFLAKDEKKIANVMATLSSEQESLPNDIAFYLANMISFDVSEYEIHEITEKGMSVLEVNKFYVQRNLKKIIQDIENVFNKK